MKRIFSSGLVLIAVAGLVWVWGSCQFSAGVKQGALRLEDDAHQHQLDSLRARLAYAEIAEASMRATAARNEARLRTIRDTNRVYQKLVESAGARGDTARLVRLLETVNSGLRDENRQLEEQVTLWKALYASADSGRRALHTSLHESERLREAWRQHARPRIRCGPVAGVGVLLSGGAGVFIGLGCTR